MTVLKCGMCGDWLDTSDCNQVHGIYTKVIGSDLLYAKKNRVYLCKYCNMEIEDLIVSRSHERIENF